MRIFGLYITTAKKHRLRQDQDNRLLGKLLSENAFLKKSTEALLVMNKNRQQGRALARRQEKLKVKI